MITMGNVAPLHQRIATLEAENEKLKAELWKKNKALAPFARCVFNDNGDITTTGYESDTQDLLAAYWAYDLTISGGQDNETK